MNTAQNLLNFAPRGILQGVLGHADAQKNAVKNEILVM